MIPISIVKTETIWDLVFIGFLRHYTLSIENQVNLHFSPKCPT